ncbi:hypothetical protein Lal_00028361 [Lupinus albus]|nr:hypothetical protein Lal_00028361 [Lupinus albus]
MNKALKVEWLMVAYKFENKDSSLGINTPSKPSPIGQRIVEVDVIDISSLQVEGLDQGFGVNLSSRSQSNINKPSKVTPAPKPRFLTVPDYTLTKADLANLTEDDLMSLAEADVADLINLTEADAADLLLLTEATEADVIGLADAADLLLLTEAVEADATDLIDAADLLILTEVAETDTPDLSHLTEGVETNTPDLAHLTEAAETDTPDLAHLTEAAETDTPDLAHLTEAAETDTPDLVHLTEAHQDLARVILTETHSKLVMTPNCRYFHELTSGLIHTTSPCSTLNNIIYFTFCIITFGTIYLFYICLIPSLS